MATSFVQMLNRLPIYNRPKEPAIGLVIGNPVLIETTNPNLPTIPLPPKYDHFGNIVSISSGSGNDRIGTGKSLPPLPGESQSEQHPPPKVIPFRLSPGAANQNQYQYQSPYSQSSYSQSPYSQSLYSQSPSPPPIGNNSAAKPTNIPRKPVQTSSTTPSPPLVQHPALQSTSGGYNLWNKFDRVEQGNSYGRRTAEVRVAPPIAPPSPQVFEGGRPRLAKHQSIDDWVKKRDEYPPPRPLKVPGKTSSPPRTPQRSNPPPRGSSIEPPQLKLNFSFEPLSSKEDLPSASEKMNPSSSKSPIQKGSPASQVSKTYVGSTDYVLKNLAESINIGRRVEPNPTEESAPKDHITELEEQRERLIAQRVAIGRELDEMEQALDPLGPNPLSTNSFKRREIKERMETRKQDLAAVEKEIFDVGMMIHRAWKRRCKSGSEGPTHLWIHNVVDRD